jgi:DNA modification methylase
VGGVGVSVIHSLGNATLINMDCLEALRRIKTTRFDAVVTDPPYELGFMGKSWDASGIAYSVELWREVLRLLKPGGHLLAFGGTRTYHRMACAIEDAGFEIRDSLMWIYGSGFPKSLDVSKAIDKAAGAEREVLGPYIRRGDKRPYAVNSSAGVEFNNAETKGVVTAPATPLAQQWEGWGTAIKPAHEPIVLARKPLIGTVAANVAAHGTGALNIDGCRIGTSGATTKEHKAHHSHGSLNAYGNGLNGGNKIDLGIGRWPANVTLDEEAAAALDAQSGTLRARGNKTAKVVPQHGQGTPAGIVPKLRHESGFAGDEGGASRFFYVAKPSRAERDRGCEHLPPRTGGEATGRTDGSAGLNNPRAGAGRGGGARNHHETVKPIALMRWLVRLITPPGGVVLDPFMGSGTTGIAALEEGFGFLGIEREAEYLEIAKARIQTANLSERK